MFLWGKTMNERKIPLDEMKKTALPAFIVAIIFFLAVVFRPFTLVPAGSRGVIFNQFKGVELNRSLSEGFHFIMPVVESVVIMDVRVQKAEFEATAASMDLQEVKARLVVNYHLDQDKVSNIYQKVGTDYENKLIKPSVEESIKAVTAGYNATLLIGRRPEVRDKVMEVMKKRLDKYFIILDDLSITDFQFTSEFAKAIENKQVAEQEALRKEYELQKAKKEASIEIARAEGEKQAIITRAQGQAEAQRLLRESLTPEIIKLKRIDAQIEAIKKWDGKLPKVTGGQVPLLNLDKISDSE